MDSLRQTLDRQGNHGRSPRLAVLGIGQELNGDDGIGPFVIRALQAALPAGQDTVFCIDAGPAPENFTGALRTFAPVVIILIDAAEMGLTPGSIRRLDWRLAEGFSASSHTLPLAMVAAYLEAELGCDVVLLGVQPQSTEFDGSLSPLVREAGIQLVQDLAGLLL